MLCKITYSKMRHSLISAAFAVVFFSLSAISYAASTEQLPEKELRQLRGAIKKADSFSDRFSAEVWMVGMNSRLSRFVKDDATRIKTLSLLHTHATKAGLSPQLVLSVIEVESHFNHFALSSAGAQGLMQVMPFWKKSIGKPSDNLMDIETNLRYGCSILSHYIKRDNGNLIAALARYNGSRGKTWYPERVLVAWEKHWFVN